MEQTLLNLIDVIQEQTDIAEIDVLKSLSSNYMKLGFLLESTDVSMFDIFCESERFDKFKTDLNSPITGNKNESVVKRIIMFLPRLIMTIIRVTRKFINTKILKRVDDDLATILNADPEARRRAQEAYEQAWREIEGIGDGSYSPGDIEDFQEASVSTYARQLKKNNYPTLSSNEMKECQIDIARGRINSSFDFQNFAIYVSGIAAIFNMFDTNSWSIDNISDVKEIIAEFDKIDLEIQKHMKGRDPSKIKSWIMGQRVYEMGNLKKHLYDINDASLDINSKGSLLMSKISNVTKTNSNDTIDDPYATQLNVLFARINNYQSIYVDLCTKMAKSIRILEKCLDDAVKYLHNNGISVIKQNW